MVKPNFDEDRRSHARIAIILLMILAGGLVLASLIFDYGTAGAATSNAIIASIVIVFALLMLRNPLTSAPFCWLTIALGLWLFVAPFILGFNGFVISMGINLLVGLLVMIFSGFILGEALRLNQALDAHS